MNSKKILLTIGFSLISTICFLQVSNPNVDSSGMIYTYDTEPLFPGGRDGLLKFIRSNFIPPVEMLELNQSGQVIVRFIVEKDGSVTHPVIEKSFRECPACDLEALRLVKVMPNWTPVFDKNKAVRSYMRLPINFQNQ